MVPHRTLRGGERPDGLPAPTGRLACQTEDGVGEHAGPPPQRLPGRHRGGGVFKAKSTELKAEAARTDEALAQLGDVAPARGETALALFDWTQRAADIWCGSNTAVRREILDCVCLNRTLGDVSLCLAKRKPFDILAEGPKIKNSRGDRIRTCDLLNPIQTR